jgi:MFS family permease
LRKRFRSDWDPEGGFLSSTIGWRWAFIIQIPILLISAVLVWLKVHIPLKNTEETPWQKFQKVDFLGSITLVSAVSCLLVGMTLKTSADIELLWSDPKVWVLLLLSGVLAIAFILTEKYIARAPLMPMRLIT